MLWTIMMILLVLWLLGLIAGIGGNMIHVLPGIAALVLIVQLIADRRTMV